MEPNLKRDAHILGIISLITLITVVLGIIFKVSGCSVGPKIQNVAPPPTTQTPPDPPAPPPPPPVDPDPVPPPEKRKCADVTTFDELSPIIGLNCSGCHSGYDTYAQAGLGKAQTGGPLIDEMIRRIQIKAGQPNHMPAGRPDLAVKDVSVFTSWLADGKLKADDCEGTPTPKNPDEFHSLAWLEQKLLEDIGDVPTPDQPNTRWIIGDDLVTRGLAEQLPLVRDAIAKAINSVSVKRNLQNPLNVAPGVWRINIDDLGIEAGDWLAIEDASQLRFESNTQKGIALKNIVKTKRLPWMYVEDFNDTALRNASIYYRLTEVPATLQQLLKNLGVRFAEDLANSKAALIGFNGSNLSKGANRLISRHTSDDGAFWGTYDTGPIISDEQSLQSHPLLAEAGGVHNLKFAAGEDIYFLPNGMLGYYLANAAGTRLNEADPVIVHDYIDGPQAPVIHLNQCHKCHFQGLVGATDQVIAGVSSSDIGAEDINRVKALFKVQPEIDRLFKVDNTRFAAAMGALGVDTTKPDPINFLSDKFYGDLTVEYVAAKYRLRVEDLKSCIESSAKGSQQANQLLHGGTISHDQWIQVNQVLIADCRIFQDPLAVAN